MCKDLQKPYSSNLCQRNAVIVLTQTCKPRKNCFATLLFTTGKIPVHVKHVQLRPHNRPVRAEGQPPQGVTIPRPQSHAAGGNRGGQASCVLRSPPSIPSKPASLVGLVVLLQTFPASPGGLPGFLHEGAWAEAGSLGESWGPGRHSCRTQPGRRAAPPVPPAPPAQLRGGAGPGGEEGTRADAHRADR